MTIADLKEHRLFGLLTASEQSFLMAYLQTSGDMGKSIRIAFPAVQNRGLKARQLQKKSSIAAILAFIDGVEKPNKELLKSEFWKLRNAKSERVRLAALQMVEELLDDENKPPSKEEIKKRMGEIDGIKQRNTSS